MSGSAWAWVALAAVGVFVLGGLLVSLMISVRRERADGYQAGHAAGRRRGRRGRGGDHR